MIKCPECSYFLNCDKATEEIINCEEYEKRGYERKLVMADGVNYKFERID